MSLRSTKWRATVSKVGEDRALMTIPTGVVKSGGRTQRKETKVSGGKTQVVDIRWRGLDGKWYHGMATVTTPETSHVEMSPGVRTLKIVTRPRKRNIYSSTRSRR